MVVTKRCAGCYPAVGNPFGTSRKERTMTTTHDDDATTWRDLADQLTAKQRAGFEDMERRFTNSGIVDDPRAQAGLLDYAREYAQHNLVDAAYADAPLPPGATTDFEGWGKDLQRGGWRRSLLWNSYGDTADVNVDISGWQQCDGSFTRHIGLWGIDEGGELTSAQARRIAAMLLEAADALEGLQ
jgi:hypothetical protein